MKKTLKTLAVLGAFSIPVLFGTHDAEAATKYLTKEQTMKMIKQADGKQKKIKTFTSKTYKDVNYTIMTDSYRFSGKVDSYEVDSMKIKTPKTPFNPKNALPIKYK